eukprot:307858_1
MAYRTEINVNNICTFWNTPRGCKRRKCKFLHIEYPSNQMQTQTKVKSHKKRENEQMKNNHNVCEPPKKKPKLNKNVLMDVTNINATVRKQEEQKQADINAKEVMVTEFMEHDKVIQELVDMIEFNEYICDG